MTGSQHTTRTPPATIRRHLVAGMHRTATSLRHVHREQTLMWELWWQANRATVPSAGPLRWVLTLDGGPPPCHRISQLAYDNTGDLRTNAGSDHGKAVIADLGNFATGGVTLLIAEP